MLNYARQRASAVLQGYQRVVLVTNGPGGVQASEVACEGLGAGVVLLVPGTSDHLFNLEHTPEVTLLAAGWELRGEGRVTQQGDVEQGLTLAGLSEAAWCAWVRVEPRQVKIKTEGGWGSVETIDL